MTPAIYFAHANGIPSACYHELFGQLQDAYEVSAMEVVGMNPQFPITLGWEHLIEEVLADMQARYNGQAVIGVGHSFGAMLLYLCAKRRPEWFQQLVMLDPPMIGGYKGMVLEWAQHTCRPLVNRTTPAGITLKRRDHWDSVEQAYAALRRNRLFEPFTEASFQAYVEHALVSDSRFGGVRLRIPKAVEARIFQTVPAYWWRKHSKQPPVPTHLITAKHSDLYTHGFPQWVGRHCGVAYTVLDGGHMFPLSAPVATAQWLRQHLQQP